MRREAQRRLIEALVVDDEAASLRIHCGAVLRAPGFRLAGTAGNGVEMFDFLSRAHADLVILDLFMPEMDGLLCLRKLRAEASSVDVVVISSGSRKETIRHCLRMGVFSYLIKPCPLDLLLRTLSSYRRFFETITYAEPGELNQASADRLLGMSSGGYSEPVSGANPASEKTLEGVRSALRLCPMPAAAEEVAEVAGISRATARRYLANLVRLGEVSMEMEYRRAGRPLHRFRILE